VSDTSSSPATLNDDRRLAANALRMLCADAVEAANSGHPGAPLGMADIAEVLWRRGIKHNPLDPAWPDRDRFVLSNGHASMLLYALLHLTGYDLPLSEIRRFRQAGSATPGHPEHGLTPGVETTTGPLGQGLANAVGMALAEKLLARTFNRPGYEIVDHRTFVFVGDGCLMEGLSHEAGSFAGVQGLEKLIVFYDDNGISIDGPVASWFADDTPMRFEAYGWRVIRNVDGHDAAEIERALAQAMRPDGRPTLICCKTVIGCGAPSKSGRAEAHGAPLGDAEIAGLRAALDWRHEPFDVPDQIKAAWDAREAGAAAQARWRNLFRAYQQAHPELAAEFERRVSGAEAPEFSACASRWIESTANRDDAMATRKASLLTLEALSPVLPELLGGSADLTESNLTKANAARAVSADHAGAYVHYGVREFAMAAIMNGVALHGGFIPFGGTFLVFTDYARNAMRLSALMRQRVIYVLTHDSIGLGEDGLVAADTQHGCLAALRSGRDGRGLARGARAARRPDLPRPFAPVLSRPEPRRGRVGSRRARRLRLSRRERREARPRSGRHGRRGVVGDGRACVAGESRRRCPRGLTAVARSVRTPAGRLSSVGLARGSAADGDRSRRDRALVEVCRSARRRRRPRRIRRFSPRQAPVRTLRIHRPTGG
jgi:transketolase